MTKGDDKPVVKRDSLGRWLPGASPNPDGPEVGSVKLGAQIKTYLKHNPDKVGELIVALIQDAIDGHPAVRSAARKLLFDYHDGPPKLQGSGEDEGPAIRIVFETPTGPREVQIEAGNAEDPD